MLGLDGTHMNPFWLLASFLFLAFLIQSAESKLLIKLLGFLWKYLTHVYGSAVVSGITPLVNLKKKK